MYSTDRLAKQPASLPITSHHRWLSILEATIALLVLAILLVFTYQVYFVKPYLGMNLNARSGEIWIVYTPSAFSVPVKPGDFLTSVNGIDWDEYTRFSFWGPPLFGDAQVGKIYQFTIEREGIPFNTTLSIQPPNLAGIIDRLVESWWWGYPFWLAGLAATLLVRPRNTRQRLLIAFMYFNAIWLSSGSSSGWRIGFGILALHAAFWLGMPVTMHLHWVFPRSLGKLPFVIKLVYILAPLMLLADLLRWIPTESYLIGGLTSVFSILFLLAWQYFRRPEGRSDIFFLLGASLIIVLPSIILGISGLQSDDPPISFSLLSVLTILPAAYFLVLYRNQSRGMELRANRIVTASLFYGLLVFFTITVLVSIPPLIRQLDEEVYFILIGLGIMLGAVVNSLGFQPFQRFVERRILRIPLASEQLVTTFAERITTTLELESLKRVLQEEILPSLLIRQSVLLRFHSSEPVEILLNHGVELDQQPCQDQIPDMLSLAGHYMPPEIQNPLGQQCDWVRLILPLRLSGQPFGLWLLGRRDPDDIYFPEMIDRLQTIANQTAIAITNIEQAEKIHALLQVNIDRHENERLRLSLELHDDILNHLTGAILHPRQGSSSEHYQVAFEAVTRRIRKMIHALRPAMLTYGLAIALEELRDEIEDQAEGKLQVVMDLAVEPVRYDTQAELHLFRIIQQAFYNALRHAQATQITITGRLTEQMVDISVRDNGIGFEAEKSQDLTWLLEHNHFGLMGMSERAGLIEAKLEIHSKPGEGTEVLVRWIPGKTYHPDGYPPRVSDERPSTEYTFSD